MQKWNISTYRAQRVDEKNDAICLVMFTSKVMVIRMSKMAHLMYFLLNTEKNRPSLGKIFKCIWKVLFGPFTKYYGLWSSVLPLANCLYLKIQDFTSPLLTQHFFLFLIYLFWYFYPQFLTKSYVQSLLNIPFSARSRWDLPPVRKYIAQTVTNFLLLSGEKTLEVNMITRQITPFFSSTLWAPSFGLFHS